MLTLTWHQHQLCNIKTQNITGSPLKIELVIWESVASDGITAGEERSCFEESRVISARCRTKLINGQGEDQIRLLGSARFMNWDGLLHVLGCISWVVGWHEAKMVKTFVGTYCWQDCRHLCCVCKQNVRQKLQSVWYKISLLEIRCP